jgi:acid stress-induced BolA-like protein IbaG/YrbA
MEPEQIQQILQIALPQASINVQGDGRHFSVRVIAELFIGKSLVDRQRYIYQLVDEHIQSGAIHALSIKAKTPAEWAQESSQAHG